MDMERAPEKSKISSLINFDMLEAVMDALRRSCIAVANIT